LARVLSPVFCAWHSRPGRWLVDLATKVQLFLVSPVSAWDSRYQGTCFFARHPGRVV
jgi:hypothetical protein